jgi:hypothetical protein
MVELVDPSEVQYDLALCERVGQLLGDGGRDRVLHNEMRIDALVECRAHNLLEEVDDGITGVTSGEDGCMSITVETRDSDRKKNKTNEQLARSPARSTSRQPRSQIATALVTNHTVRHYTQSGDESLKCYWMSNSRVPAPPHFSRILKPLPACLRPLPLPR